ncbi:MAG TPA: hypothetical protein VL688_02075 [Verrucomicrobiae bacterium]|jgi:D-alanine-D-alanine ligase|nr:hypothetical protein [Verrucomicrobiae bacterium]
MKKQEKILVVFNTLAPTTLDQDYTEDLKQPDWETEADVIKALQALGHDYQLLGLYEDTRILLEKIKQYPPTVIFNLVERFRNDAAHDRDIVSLFKLLDVPFTGCNPTGLTLCKNKALSKQILSYARIPVPNFAILPRGKTIRRPKRLDFPIFIKPLKEEASLGIAQASFVENDTQFKDRVAFIHETLDQDVIAEGYIEGRELYVGVIGNKRLEVFPVREMRFNEVPEDEPKFASYKAKWDENYRKKWGIVNQFAGVLPAGAQLKIEILCKKIYQLLSISGYARLDLRLTPSGEIVFIEANPNPILSAEEDFAASAAKAGTTYPQLIQKIINLSRPGSED